MANAPVFGGFAVQLAHHQFYDDCRRLEKADAGIAAKVHKVVERVVGGELRHPSHNTRRIEGNPDKRFHLVDISDKYRMVIAFEAGTVYFYCVGNHDETLKAGEQATLNEHRGFRRLDSSAIAPRRSQKRDTQAAPPPQAVQQPLLPDEESVGGGSLADMARHTDELFDLVNRDVLATLQGYEDGLLEDWMIFLAPAQRRAVERAQAGPFKVTGGPGTGKSVVALHAIKRKLESQKNAKILVTSFVRTVPKVLERLAERLAGDAVRTSVEFSNVHSIARRLVKHARKFPSDSEKKSLLQEAMDATKQPLVKPRDWLDTEIGRVIFARMIPDLATYLSVQRIGRKVPVAAAERAAIWEVYANYLKRLQAGGYTDWDQLLVLAAEVAPGTPEEKKYDMIIVDEAQDLTESGVRMLLALLKGGASGNIVFVGDGKQRLYAGGYSLKDLGVRLVGKSVNLNLCYRTTEEIMRAVGALGKTISLEDYGEDGVGTASLDYRLTGPQPEYHSFADADAQWAWIIDQLDPDDAETFDGTAILFASRREVEAAQTLLRNAGIGHVNLEKYEGTPVPGVKVGTMKRAKGLEFYRVYLPNLGADAAPERRDDEDEYLEQASELYVAMSRARDRLVITGVGEPTYLLREAQGDMKVAAHSTKQEFQITPRLAPTEDR